MLKRFWWIGWLVVAYFVLCAYLRVSGDMFDGYNFPEQAGKPFVFRVLSPVLIQVIAPLIPESWFPNSAIIDQLGAFSPRNYGAATFVLMYVSLALIGIGIEALMRDLGYAFRHRLIAIGLFCLFLPGLFTAFAKFYDLPHTALILWCMITLYRRQWGRFTALYVLTCFSRETVVFLVPLFFLVEPSRRRILPSLGLAAAAAAVRLLLMAWFADYPGDNQASYVHLFLEFGGGWVFIGVHLAMSVLLGMGFYRWKEKPLFLRQAYASLLALTVPAYFLFGFPMEVRVFLEVFLPMVMLYMPAGQAGNGVKSVLRRQAPQHVLDIS
jgi:hypothetical protein